MLDNKPKKTGILLVNLGSPSEPSIASVRRYLRQFLWDPRVVNIPRLLWWFILNFIILPFRPKKTARAYRKIWSDQGAPLVVLTRHLVDKIADQLNSDTVQVEMAMRYGQPSISSQLDLFNKQELQRLIILPLYPQYSSTTTASVFDLIFKVLQNWKHIPETHLISDYYQDVHYINSVAAAIAQSWSVKRGELLLMSFHGLPAKLVEWGDPYFDQCHKTASLIADKLGLKQQEWMIVFQSRFGRTEWLQPYCITTLEQLPNQGVKDIDIVCPGFAVDCLETLEEIAMTNRAAFIDAGGESYQYIPALNATENHVETLIKLSKKLL